MSPVRVLGGATLEGSVKILPGFIGFPVEESKEKAVTDSGEM